MYGSYLQAMALKVDRVFSRDFRHLTTYSITGNMCRVQLGLSRHVSCTQWMARCDIIMENKVLGTRHSLYSYKKYHFHLARKCPLPCIPEAGVLISQVRLFGSSQTCIRVFRLYLSIMT